MFSNSAASLVTEVSIHRPNGLTRMHNIPVRIESRRGLMTNIEFVSVADEVAITIRLSGAERIALIEMLGGKVEA